MYTNNNNTKSGEKVDIGLLLKKFKQANTKLSPLPLEQFQQVAFDSKIELLQLMPDYDKSLFTRFEELNQGAVSELKRSFLQSKQIWNNYGHSLFTEELADQPKYYTSRKMQMIHNRDTFRKIKEQYKKQEESSIEEVKKYFKKIKSKMPEIKSYPSLQYQDLQKMESIRRQIKISGMNDQNNKNKDVQEMQMQVSQQINEIKIKKQIVYIYKDVQIQWQPCSRNGSTMLSYNHNLYLYGGAGAKQNDDFCCAVVDKKIYKWQQIKLEDQQQSGFRSNHSAAIYKNFMIIFGGDVHQISNNKRISSEITCDIKIINLITNELKVLKQTGIIPPRKSHIAEVIGRSMIVHGGIDIKGQYLRDIIAFDLLTQRWNQVVIEQNNCFPDGVAFHKSAAIYFSNQIELYKTDNECKLNNQGVYIFGGFDKNGHYLDGLIRIDTTTKPVGFEQVQTKGMSPIGRCQHSMNYIEKYQLIVIYGGKNDDLNINGFLNDIHLLDIKNRTWISVDIKGNQVAGRCNHTSSCIDSKLYIFGGYNYSGFVKSDLLVIELDPVIVQKLAQEDVITEKPFKQQMKVTFKNDLKKDQFQEIKQQINQICLQPQKQLKSLHQYRRISDILSTQNFKEFKVQSQQNYNEEIQSQTNQSSVGPVLKHLKRTMTTIVNPQ
ncbi:unnamed protein product [Paramecium sonneborni]|uniref:Kelch motif family protein n=1 Tax=Paramecium sonneborni TaxID=65129 RepID=A0A8S1KMS4_9CILI|nr:unnamed protein product [Paramecium sonneborni]